ncbi:hypothetical protein AUR64_13840 [Haloprofundus marisrubri]|uniref:Nucleotide modification associated domain-containing protein n=1 Tax=Haloprofundus marisrubri TaxID=1514971 RepID=A0A0W1R628_9EURY|nr:hypothetical protein [Haloprofundus marisrubri]KTG08888.1 hypothetical protein AUR64_13840 [Haloprofundus marisrubri]
MPRSIAINVAANTNLPGFRGPVYPDGRFEYVPIPEREETSERVPTYGDLSFGFDLPPSVLDTPVHLDPAFAGVHGATRHTYGDEHGVKAGPLSELSTGDSLFFYATLSLHGDSPTSRRVVDDDWGTYLIGEFRVQQALTGEEYLELPAADRERFAENAHVRRDPFDAKVLVEGGEESGLFERVVPLSSREAGATANRLVTELSNDSGKGPWWRRRFWYDESATTELRAIVDGSIPATDAPWFGRDSK